MKFVYFKESMFGISIVSEIRETPFGISIVFDNRKPMPYEEVERLLTVSEIRSRNLVLGWID